MYASGEIVIGIVLNFLRVFERSQRVIETKQLSSVLADVCRIPI